MGAALVTPDFLCVCSPEVVGQNPSFVALNNNSSISCCQMGVITKHRRFMLPIFGMAGGSAACPCSHMDVTSEGHSHTAGVCTHPELVVDWEELPFCKGVV